ncbi:MAG: hypothetical protein ABSB74_09220 [Tepidisphaeraceae bacterium]
MKFIQFPKSFLVLICLTLVALYIPGCLTADKSVSAAYDAQHDRFRFLIVFQNIATQADKSAADFAWLRSLYANRDHLILSPIGSPWPWEGFGEGAYLRISNSLYAGVDLSAAATSGLTREIATIPLDDIQVLPGRFFIRGRNSLCYFQQIVIPGKTVDEMVEAANHRLAAATSNSLVGWIDSEFQHRQSGLTSQMAWDAFTKGVIDQTTWAMRHESSDRGQPTTRIDDPFNTQTLQSLRSALVSGKAKLIRTGDKIHVSAEMTEADVSGLVAFVEAFRESVSGAAAEPARESRRNLAWRAMLDSAALTATDKTHVEATVDLTKLVNAFYNPLEIPPSGIEPKGNKVQNMLDVAGDSLEIDSHLTVGKIVADFKADALPTYPPLKSVEPGRGMGNIHPATEPSQQ